MTSLLLAAVLVFQHEPPKPKPPPTIEIGHHVWILQVDDWGREVKRDWGPVIDFWGGNVTVDGRLFEWDAPIGSVRRIGDK